MRTKDTKPKRERGTPWPTRFTEHAIDRFVERWAPPAQRGPMFRPAHAVTMRGMLRTMKPGAWLNDEQQQIWTWEGPLPWLDHGHVEIKFVVDVEGVVRTVLPPNAMRPASRRKPRDG